MKNKIIMVCFVLILSVCGLFSTANVYAQNEWFGSGDDNASGGSGTQDPGTHNCGNTRTLLSCLGYSWIFFEAVQGAPKVDLEFRPLLNYKGVKRPIIDKMCANWEKEGMGFWHLGRNAVSYADPNKPVFNSWGEEVLHPKSYNTTDTNRFYLNWGNSFGHMATYNYRILRTTYRWAKYRYKLSDFPTNINNAVKNSIIRGVDGSQSLYKKINGVPYKIYESKYIASEQYVFEEFKKAWFRAYETPYTGDGFPDGLYAFCFAPYFYELKAVSIDQDRNSLAHVSGLGDKTVRVREDNLASVTRGTNNGYEFLGWRLSPNGGYVTTTNTSSASYVSGSSTPKETFNVKSLKNDFTVYAVYKEKMSFKGQIKANNAAIIGYTDRNESKQYNINNCNPVSGCKVTFEHNLQRTSVGGATNYSISRTSNYWNGSLGVRPKDPLASGRETFVSGNPKNVYTDVIILKPGQVVCETLNFNSYSSGDGDVKLTICVSALGDAQPPDPADPNDPNKPENDPNGNTGSGMFVDIEVRNNNVSRYNTYRRIVYAKPMDNLTYRASYNPVLQYTYHLKPQKLRINGGTIYPASGINISRLLKDIYNERKTSGLLDWNNAFTVLSEGPGFDKNYKYSGGDTTERNPTNNYKVLATDVGKTLKETAKTNVNNNTKTTPSQVTFTNDNNNNVGNVITADKEKSALARVPYNFSSSAEIVTSSEETLNAGSSKQIDYKINILRKNNAETTNGSTDQAYATIVRDAKSKVIVYATSGGVMPGAIYGNDNLCAYFSNATNCEIKDEKSYSQLNQNWNNGNGTSVNGRFSIDVLDVNAGAKICVAAAFYPSDSGNDKNLNKTGSGKWRISESKCFTVGKKPTFQVWGGSFYGAKNIATLSSAKKDSNKVIVFGSWAEQSVISNGLTTGMSSAAALGLANNSLGGGSLEQKDDFCKYRTPLSFANYARAYSICPMAPATGLSGIEAKKITIDNFIEETTAINDNVTIGNTTINASNTYVVNTNGNVYINGDIIYQDGIYTELSEIPKAFIAANNISIACNVKRIDAILIAKNKLDTCSGSNNDTQAGLDAPNRSNQLVINGAIATGILDLNRTFGAATGIYSKIPAEIINYDTSVILWGRSIKNSEDYGRVYQTYLHELAPRY